MFGSSLTLFRVFGIEIKVNLSWAFIALLIAWSLASGTFPEMHEGLAKATYWAMGFLAVVGIFFSILLHELAHSLVALKHGIPMRGITLHLFGGAAEMEAEPTSARTEFLMAIAGPACSVAIGLILRLILWASGLGGDDAAGILLRYLATLNFILAAFNMLPAFPLDGGRVLRAALWARSGDRIAATRTATRIGGAIGFGMAGLGLLQILAGAFGGGLWLVLIGFFIRSAAQTAEIDLAARSVFTGHAVADYMTADLVTVGPNMAVGDFLESVVYRSRHAAYPVVDGGGLARGIVQVGSLHRLPREDWAATPVLSIMDPVSPEITVGPDRPAVEALEQMQRTGQGRLLVVADGKLVGLLTLKDLLDTLSLRMQFDRPVK